MQQAPHALSPTRYILANARGLHDDTRVDIAVTATEIEEIRPSNGVPVGSLPTTIDCGGRIVVPAFADPHLHLDKALLGGVSGSLAQAISDTTRQKKSFTVRNVADRARTVLNWAYAAGTVRVRAHTDVDPDVGFVGVEGVLTAAADSPVDVQLALVPQEGLFCRPGTAALLREGLEIPGTVVGGCPYVEHDVHTARQHVEHVLDLAAEFDRDADLHLDFSDTTSDPRFTLARDVARATVARGLTGRVTIGHATSLSALPDADRRRTIEALAEADVAIVILPATDLFLNGRSTSGTRRSLAPVRELWAAGVRTALGSNNVRNAFTPSGRASQLDMALLLGRTMHAADEEDWGELLRMATTRATRIIAGREASLTRGALPDLIVLDTTVGESVVMDQPTPWLTVRGGRPYPTPGVSEAGKITWSSP